ncbi:MAG: LysM peptidoglycan-binding domain-containing protein [Pseudomonadota bacterium]
MRRNPITRSVIAVFAITIPIAGTVGAAFVAAPVAASTRTTSASADCVSPYTVGRGDTLSLIAERFLGDVMAFRVLHDLNRGAIGPDPALLEVGTVLQIPCPAGSTARDTGSAAAEQAEVAPPPRVAAPDGGGEGDAGRADALETAGAPSPGGGPFITVSRLAAIAESQRPQIVDVRPGGAARLDFIPRATQLPDGWDDKIAQTAANRRALDRKLASAGLRIDRPFVLVASDNRVPSLGRAAITAWVLRAAGAEDVTILWGGMAAWSAARRPAWDSAVTPRPRPDGRVDLAAPEVGTAAWQRALTGEGAGRLVVVSDTAVADNVPAGAIVADLPEFDAETPDELALNALAWLKTVPVGWETTAVGITAAEPGHAALAWLIAAEVSGIRNVWLAPPLSQLASQADQSG